MWNPQNYTKHNAIGDELVELTLDFHLSLLIPPGTVTFPNRGTAIDLVWGSADIEHKILKCRIAEDHDQGSDHLPIETVLASPTPNPAKCLLYNFSKINLDVFDKKLKTSLPTLPTTNSSWSPQAVDTHTEELVKAI